MMTGRKSVVMAVAILMVAAIFCGCLGDGDDGVKWDKPTQVRVEKVMPDTVGQKVNITLKLFDVKDQVSEWDVQLRLIAVDSDDFSMLNRTYDIKAKDFKSSTTNNVVDTKYEMSVPFVEFTKSKDRVAGLFMTGKQMTIFAWITYGGSTYKQSPTHSITNTVGIPTGLLVPNEAPRADLVGYTTGFVGQSLKYNASASNDDTGFDNLSFEWEWGDGRTTTFLADSVESHTYREAGTFKVNVTVSDPEGANDTKSLTVTISEPLEVTILGNGTVTTPGEHFGDTFVDFTIKNIATFDVDISELNPKISWAGVIPTNNNGTETVPPDEVEAGATVTVKVYFDLSTPLASHADPVIIILNKSYALS